MLGSINGENMAVVTFDIDELQKFIKKARPINEITDAFEKLGMPVEKIEGNEVSVDITPDHIEMFTVEGSGRAISHFLGISKPKKYSINDSKDTLSVDNVPGRPYVVAGIVKGVTLDEKIIKTFVQAQEKIHDTFGRRRKKVAIGIHDYDKTKPPYSYKNLRHITFIPLDSDKEMNPQQVLSEHKKGIEFGKIYEGINKYPLVLDSDGVISFPPIINAERTRVTEKTKNLFIEITGTSEWAIRDVLHVFLTAFYDRGAKIENVKLEVLPSGEKDSAIFERTEKFDLDYVNKILGKKFTADEICKLLEKMGYPAKVENGENREKGKEKIVVNPPPYRSDIMHPIDFTEDVAIGYGYENFEPTLPNFITVGKEQESKVIEEKIRKILIGLGFTEVLTWNLTNKEMMNAALIEDTREAAEIQNPRTKDFTYFRTDIFPSVLYTLLTNKTKKFPQKLFEIGRTADAKGNCKTRICAAITDKKITFNDIRGVYDVLNEYLKSEKTDKRKTERRISGIREIREANLNFLIPGRGITITQNGEVIGWCGEIHPQVIENFKLELPVAMLEIDLD